MGEVYWEHILASQFGSYWLFGKRWFLVTSQPRCWGDVEERVSSSAPLSTLSDSPHTAQASIISKIQHSDVV